MRFEIPSFILHCLVVSVIVTCKFSTGFRGNRGILLWTGSYTIFGRDIALGMNLVRVYPNRDCPSLSKSQKPNCELLEKRAPPSS